MQLLSPCCCADLDSSGGGFRGLTLRKLRDRTCNCTWRNMQRHDVQEQCSGVNGDSPKRLQFCDRKLASAPGCVCVCENADAFVFVCVCERVSRQTFSAYLHHDVLKCHHHTYLVQGVLVPAHQLLHWSSRTPAFCIATFLTTNGCAALSSRRHRAVKRTAQGCLSMCSCQPCSACERAVRTFMHVHARMVAQPADHMAFQGSYLQEQLHL